MKKIKRFLPLALIVILMIIAYFLGWFDDLNFETLKNQHMELKNKVKMHPFEAPFVFIGVYFLAVLISIPGASFLSLLGGFLFQQPMAFFYVLIGASTGSIGLFFAAKTALGDYFEKKAKGKLKKMSKGFRKNAVSYMLFLRFVPLFPFWLVNIAPALFNVRFMPYFWTTVVGICPGSYVFTVAGKGLSVIFESKEFNFYAIFNWHIKIAFLGLALLSLVPLVVQKIRNNHKKTKKRNKKRS